MRVGTRVIRNDSDSECPTVGRVLGHEDEDRVLVAWGDAAYSATPFEFARVEFADELTPYGRR